MTSSRSLLYLLLSLALVRGVLYASFTPPWQAPDEPAQFERVRASLSRQEWNSTSENAPAWYADMVRSLFAFNIYDYLDTNRKFYSPTDPLNQHVALYQEIYHGLYGSRPMYVLMGWPLFLAREQDITLQLFLVRLNTVLMNAGIIWLAYLTSRALFPHDDFLALGVPALILFNPQHSHLLATVNNGNLAELLSTAALYFWTRSILRRLAWGDLLIGLGFAVAAMWTKATAYFLPAVLGVIILLYLWRFRQYWRWLVPAGLGLVGLTYLLAPLRLKLLLRDAWLSWQGRGFSLDPIVPQDLFRSFWAMPGWTIFYIHPIWYQGLGLFCLLALAGLLVWATRHWRDLQAGRDIPQAQALAALGIAVAASIGILLAWNGLTHSIVYRQGRSIYPVMVPIALFLMLGWRALIPPRWRRSGLFALITLFFLFDTMVLFHYFIPFFYSRY